MAIKINTTDQAAPELLPNLAGFIGTNEQFLNALGVIASRSGTDGIIAAVALEQLDRSADLAAPSAKPVACLECGDTGVRDTGGVHPWGEHISAPCDCTPSRAGTVSVEAAALENVLRRGRNITASMRIARKYIGDNADRGHLEAVALRYVRWQDLAFLDAALRDLAGEEKK